MDTFVVRVWGPPSGRATARPGLRKVRGVIEHVASGRSSAFRGLEELGALILSGDDWPSDPLAGRLDDERVGDARAGGEGT